MEITLEEIVSYELSSHKTNEDLVIAIYWVGYNLNQEHFKKSE